MGVTRDSAATAIRDPAVMSYELAERTDAGIVVRLLWDEPYDQVIVEYRDYRADEFAAVVPKNQALARSVIRTRIGFSSVRLDLACSHQFDPRAVADARASRC